MERKLYRSRKNRVFLGVCGGFGEFFNIDPVVIRVIAVIITLCTGIFPGLIAYFVIALIVPVAGSTASTPEQFFRENVDEIKNAPQAGQEPVSNNTSVTGLIILGIVLIGVGAFIILQNYFHLFWRFTFPAALVLAGIVIILIVLARRR